MKNPLQPQVRVNKNGVPVTKHVKDSVSASAGLRSFPSPAMLAKPANSPEGHTARLELALTRLSTSAGTSYFHPCITDPTDDSLLRVLEEALEGTTHQDKSFRRALRDIVRMATPELVSRNLRAAVVLRDSVRADILNRVIAGLSESIGDHAERLNEAPPEIQEKARAIAASIEILHVAGKFGYNYGGKKFFVTAPKLAAAIHANPERAGEYVDFCTERGSDEALDTIDSVPATVRSGLL